MASVSGIKSFFGRLMSMDLLSIPVVRRLVMHRAFQWAVMVPNLIIFWFLITAGFIGSPVGNMNISITFVWMLWWFALIAILVPFFGRAWCTICPLPALGEWLQRGSMVRKPDAWRPRGLNRRWPRRLNNIWLQNIGFLVLASFSALLVTRPIVTAIVLAGLILVATIVMLVYSKRAFCRYLCPVGGFIGLFSNFSSIELRVKDGELCKNHIDKECIRGSDTSFGCPWYEYPGSLVRNAYCGLCFECVKACPFNNIRLNLRGFGRDLIVSRGKGFDEAWKVFIMLALAGVYIVTMQGPWGWIRDLANVFYKPPYGFALAGIDGYLIYLGLVWGSTLLIIPGLFYIFSIVSKYLSKTDASASELFKTFSYMLVPLTLMAWIAFSIPILQVNWAYIVNTLSDPFGWGWNLFGTRDIHWSPILPSLIPYEQVAVILVGVFYSIKVGYEMAREKFMEDRALLGYSPYLIFTFLAAIFFIWLFMG